ncbi:glycosyltransferase [Clostridiaceae bacterium]|nr:glycosyltransferase [Clostridiaceae bacterium]
MKKCIFHIPIALDPNALSASGIRPMKMLQAFREIGYEVAEVSGDAKSRKKAIREIKANIKKGVHYDFLYSESSTTPTILTEKHHFPTHPFLDFSFFEFCRKNHIKIGLFYRDIYWKFDTYKKALPAWKAFLAIYCYKYDLKKYEQLLNKLYLPSLKLYSYIKIENLDFIADVLPPGCQNQLREQMNEDRIRNFDEKPLVIFYVGGLGECYDISELMAAVSKIKQCKMIICCRKNEWEKEKDSLKKYIVNGNIEIIHKNNQELEPYYEQADICCLLFRPYVYRELAIPFKAFEYLGHLKPVLVSKKTLISEFVDQYKIGWSMEYSTDVIYRKLSEIIENPDLLQEKKRNCIKAREENTWCKRAEKVAADLK